MTDSAAGFQGFTRHAIEFMADLAANNERSWFQPRKADYERLVKQPMERLCVALADRFESRGIPLEADPKRSPFRIYRDTRFSRNKDPYKTHVAATFPWTGGAAGVGESAVERAHANGGYFSFQPGEMYFGGGVYMAEKPFLEAFRNTVRDHPERVRSALHDEDFVKWFGAAHSHAELKRVPPGYPPEHPLADLFRWKDVIFGRRLSDREVCSAELPDIISDGYSAAMPVFRLLSTLD